MDVCDLLDAVRIEECTREIYDGFSAPVHHEAAAVSDVSDVVALEVFLVGLGDEIGDLGSIDTDGHALLGFGNCEFGAVEAGVFFSHGIKVDHERRRNFADGYGDATCSEVVANLNLARQFGITK